MVTHAGFVASLVTAEAYCSNIFKCPGFTLAYIKPDWMHVVCLGIRQYLEGNVTLELFQRVGGTFSSAAKGCSTLLNLIKLVAKELGFPPPFH